MATMEEAAGWDEASAQNGSYDLEGLGMAGDVEVAPAAELTLEGVLREEELVYATRMAAREAAAMRHFGKDPRDLDPRDML